MKIEELSVGDWVFHLAEMQAGRISHIHRIGGIYSIGLDCADCVVVCGINDIAPIALTPVILEKNGFVKITEDMVWAEHLNPKLAEIPTWGLKIGERPVPYLAAKMRDNNHFEITTTNIELFRFKVGHVHQLQHTLRLAGIEKDIEL